MTYLLLLLFACVLPLLTGCDAGGPTASATVSFSAAESAGSSATVEGIPITSSLKRQSGKPSEFRMKEESSAREMRVSVPEGVTLPANFSSASYVLVTGTYDAAQRVMVATQVQTRVPTREQQPRG